MTPESAWTKWTRRVSWLFFALHGFVAAMNGIALMTGSPGFDESDLYRPAFWSAYNLLMAVWLFAPPDRRSV